MEYRSGNQKVILLLHGGGLSWWNFRESGKRLGERYRVILPILDGHGAGSLLEVKKGLYHGEYSLNKPERYAAELERFLTS